MARHQHTTLNPHKPQPPTHPPVPLDPPKPQTWRICQNYSALNRVTQVFSTPTGDIYTKQQKLSGYWWIHKFNLTSGFYTIFVPAPMRPYLAFYTESGGFLTQKRMPFGLKGSPATFHLGTSENLSDRLPRLDMELIVDDSGMAGNDFNDMMH